MESKKRLLSDYHKQKRKYYCVKRVNECKPFRYDARLAESVTAGVCTKTKGKEGGGGGAATRAECVWTVSSVCDVCSARGARSASR